MKQNRKVTEWRDVSLDLQRVSLKKLANDIKALIDVHGEDSIFEVYYFGENYPEFRVRVDRDETMQECDARLKASKAQKERGKREAAALEQQEREMFKRLKKKYE